MASTWAATACLHDPPNGLDRIQSAAYQKDRARAQAFLNWEVDFHRERCISDFRATVTGHPIRLQPFMFKTVCKLFRWFSFTIYLLAQYYEVNKLNCKQ
jgi:hypothetical protein